MIDESAMKAQRRANMAIQIGSEAVKLMSVWHVENVRDGFKEMSKQEGAMGLH